MKVQIAYLVLKDVDIPEENIKAILNNKNVFGQGAFFNTMAKKYNSDLAFAINKIFDNVEIQDVYNPCIKKGDDWRLLNEDYPEVLWEM